MKSFGLVKGVGAAGPGAPRGSYTGDPYCTDGLRLVIWITPEPITYQHVESVRWEVMPAPKR